MTIWHIGIACWIHMATNTLSEYVTLNAFPLQQSLPERASMLRCTYSARLLFSKASTSALGPTQDTFDGYRGRYFREQSDRSVKLTIGLHIPLGLIFPHTSWSRTRGQIYPYCCKAQKFFFHLKLPTRLDLQPKLRTRETTPHSTHVRPSLQTLLPPFYPIYAERKFFFSSLRLPF